MLGVAEMGRSANESHYVEILASLANGVDPFSRELLPEDSIIHHPAVIRALFHAVGRLKPSADQATRDINVQKGRERSHRAGRPWSTDEDRNLIQSFRSRVPFHQIAEGHGRSKGAIISRLVRIGEIQPRPLAELNESGNQSATANKDWKKDRPNAGKPWTKEEDERLRVLHSQNTDILEIARTLGRGEFAVDVRLHKLGLVGG